MVYYKQRKEVDMTRRRNEMHDFLEKCQINPSTWCWEYKGVTDRDGYGQFGYDNKMWLVHRLAYMLYFKKTEQDIQGKVVMHMCDNPCCVNPSHLKLGTQKENIADMHSKNRGPDRKGANNPNAKLTDYQVQKIRDLISLGMTQEQLAKMFNVSRRTIHNIRNNISWNHVSSE